MPGDDLQLTAPAPDPVTGISAQIVGPLGLMIYHYWWVAHYPIGVAVVSAPVTVRNAPDVSTLSATNYVIVAGQPALGATSYDLLRTNSSRLPVTGPTNIAVATGLTSPTFNDQGAALTSYNIAGLAAGAPVSAFIALNNRDYAQPTIVMSPFGTAVQGLVFPDGSTQSTAGASPYNWTQDVQTNGHHLLGLTGLTLNSPGVLQFGDGTTQTTAAASPYNWTQNVQSNGNQLLGLTGLTLSTGSFTVFEIKNTTAPLGDITFGVISGVFQISDQTAAAGTKLRITIPAGSPGKIGLSTGASFTPAHLLELNADDAAKPTTNTWTISSDIRTKRNVKPLQGGMAVIDQLQPIEAEYNGCAGTPDGTPVVSFDPDQLAKVLPRSVSRVRRKLHPDDFEESDIGCVNPHEILHHLVLAVQQLSRQINTKAPQSGRGRKRGKEETSNGNRPTAKP